MAESTPGPIAINLATYVGYKKKGVLGSTLATLGVIIPSLVIIYSISLFFDLFMQNEYVKYAFVGIKCAVAFLILKAGVEMFQKLDKKVLPRVTFVLTFVLLTVIELLSVKFSSIYLILIGGALGIAFYALPFKREGEK